MPRHSERRALPYTPDQMYDLVADVARYPEFLPWTAAARIRSRTGGPEGEVMLADLIISFKLFRESFGSRVTLWPGKKRIETEYLDGPFRHLQSEWTFTPTASGCEVDFWVDFEFRNPIIGRVVGVVFNEAMQRVVAAFEKRARQLYGASAA
ncbi:type II toxin-antitoxin system RatA family toxin [Jannaschia pohangensis]|uniref:Coenzyme Q-binding protein COQ10 n=1 Tax=Jannaschia pohangensis TaxID=390807 RepID=A0A1I3H2I9_9RHOB|nr:type II toxin-antitoxin system RatA family toxin [Jannaschia pohangensis]SFI30058.1 coenzyme Q-binding protein COQ10 [Jannaschia pohangensis]